MGRGNGVRAAMRAGALGAWILLAGCDGDATAPPPPSTAAVLPGPTEVVLAPGEDAFLGEDAVRVGFVRVVEDSRCPAAVVCVWEGNAVVEVAVEVGAGPPVLRQLNTTLEPRSTLHEGLRLTLRELAPDPPPAGGPAPSYRLTLLVEPAGG